MSRVSGFQKRVNRLVGRAIHDHDLLNDGDRIMVAVSGGSDSLVTAWFLRHWQTKAPIRYQLIPVHLDMGFEGHDWRPLAACMETLGLPFHVEQTDYGPRAHGPSNEKKSPCFLCALFRRKRLFEIAHHWQCNKIAFGHNQDDVLETFFINMLYSGELSTMLPRQEMFKGLLTLIRPLALVEKRKIDRLAAELGLPVMPNLCPSAGQTKREDIKRMLADICRSNPKARGNIVRALSNVRLEYLPVKSPPDV